MAERVSSVVLDERRDAGGGLSLITLTPAHERAQAYRAPGQYIEVRSNEENGYFALAGEIGASTWELLVRANGGVSDVLLRAPVGTVLDVVGPLGRGFPLEQANGRPLIVAVAGSALAVARPILRERIARGETHRTSVYLGARTLRDVALASEVTAWTHAGARVVLCLSRAALEDGWVLGGPEARRASGYVQNVLLNDVVEGLLTEGLIFAAGPAGPEGLAEGLERSLAGVAVAGKLEVMTNV